MKVIEDIHKPDERSLEEKLNEKFKTKKKNVDQDKPTYDFHGPDGKIETFYCKVCMAVWPLEKLVKGPASCNNCGRRAICHRHAYEQQKERKNKSTNPVIVAG